MKYIKSFFKVTIIFLGVVLLLALALFFNRKRTEIMASDFCHAAIQEKSLDDVRNLLTTTKGVSHSIFFENVATIQFSLWTGERYVCVIEFDDSGKPHNIDVVYKD